MSSWWINDSGQNTLKGVPQFVASDGKTFRWVYDAQEYEMLTGHPYEIWRDDFGVAGDKNNPMVLEDDFVLNCLYTVRKAREDFWKGVPSLDSAEQTRFARLVDRAPFAVTGFLKPQRDYDDALMDKFNKDGIFTTGPRGGRGYG